MLTQLSWLKIKPTISPHWQKKLLLWGSAICLNSLALPSQAQITQYVLQAQGASAIAEPSNRLGIKNK